MDTKKILIIGGVTAVSITFIVGLAIWLSSPSCQLVENEPTLELHNMARKGSKDRTALADFEGYIDVVQDGARSFLPLNLKSVSVYKEETSLELTIIADCARITFEVDTSSGYSINSAIVNIFSNQVKLRECSINMLQIYFDNDTHYSCRKRKKYRCFAHGDIEVAEIHFGLEIEVDRNPNRAVSDEYLTQPSFCD